MNAIFFSVARAIFGSMRHPLRQALVWGRRQWRNLTTRQRTDSTLDFIAYDLKSGKPLSHDVHERLLKKMRRNQRYGR